MSSPLGVERAEQVPTASHIEWDWVRSQGLSV